MTTQARRRLRLDASNWYAKALDSAGKWWRDQATYFMDVFFGHPCHGLLVFADNSFW
tara:strand:+ start:7475 stop:7645 length:171 start_codon:yes stop_codon:yes gene_type:complete